MMEPMRRESPYPMVSIADARRIVAEHTPLLPPEEISSLDADRRILAEDVVAAADLPDVPKSAVDGYALRSIDGVAERCVMAELTAGGGAAMALIPGTAARIMTGAPLPPGADAVVMVEQTEEIDGMLRITSPVLAGNSVHMVGQDVAHGTLVLPRGTVLGSAEIGLLATLGRARVQVYRQPVVAVLATGDEVHEPDAEVPAGGVRDSNRYALMAAARDAGCTTISLGIARDKLDAQRAAILSGVERADVLLTSGGVSMGTRDLIKPLLAELGTVHFGRVAFKPGKPTTFATLQGKLAFGLPGYPVSSLVSFEMFVRPALRTMQGDLHPDRPRVQVRLREAIQASGDRLEFQRAVVSWEAGQLVARSTGSQSSSRLLSLRGANALLAVPGDGLLYPAGAMLEAWLTGPLL